MNDPQDLSDAPSSIGRKVLMTPYVDADLQHEKETNDPQDDVRGQTKHVDTENHDTEPRFPCILAITLASANILPKNFTTAAFFMMMVSKLNDAFPKGVMTELSSDVMDIVEKLASTSIEDLWALGHTPDEHIGMYLKQWTV
jgi:hypothetical protein